LRAWLAAATAEFLAAVGDAPGALQMLDQAESVLPAGDMDPELPYVMLNGSNLARWRGHCLARLGHDNAIAELTSALESSDLSSRRAESGLRVDLALAFRKLGDSASSVEHAKRAAELAGSTGSARQRTRIARLIAA
jgi:tetratricopeptide (TPR) repeat protein